MDRSYRHGKLCQSCKSLGVKEKTDKIANGQLYAQGKAPEGSTQEKAVLFANFFQMVEIWQF